VQSIAGGQPRTRQTLADTEETLKILWYGEQGTGKTLDMATLARRGPVIFVNAEGGLKKRPLRVFEVPAENIELRPATSYQQLEALYWEVKRMIEGQDPFCPIGILFDSMSEITKVITTNQVILRTHAAREKHDSMGTVPKESEINPFRVQLDDYGIMTEQLRALTRKFRDLPIHVGFSALSRREVDASGGEIGGDTVTYRPGLTPAFGNDLRGFVDIVVATKVATDGQWVGITKPRFGLMGKDRFGVLPVTMVDPTFDRICAVVNDEIDPEEVKWVPQS